MTGERKRNVHAYAVGYLPAGSDCVVDSEVFIGCEPGFYCHIEDLMTLPFSGQCQPSPAIGEPCTGNLLECGLGVGLCGEAGVCEPAVPNGGSCGENHFVCESFNCGLTSGVCEPLMMPPSTQCGIPL